MLLSTPYQYYIYHLRQKGVLTSRDEISDKLLEMNLPVVVFDPDRVWEDYTLQSKEILTALGQHASEIQPSVYRLARNIESRYLMELCILAEMSFEQINIILAQNIRCIITREEMIQYEFYFARFAEMQFQDIRTYVREKPEYWIDLFSKAWSKDLSFLLYELGIEVELDNTKIVSNIARDCYFRYLKLLNTCPSDARLWAKQCIEIIYKFKLNADKKPDMAGLFSKLKFKKETKLFPEVIDLTEGGADARKSE